MLLCEQVRFWHGNLNRLANRAQLFFHEDSTLAKRWTFSCQKRTRTGTLTVHREFGFKPVATSNEIYL